MVFKEGGRSTKNLKFKKVILKRAKKAQNRSALSLKWWTSGHMCEVGRLALGRSACGHICRIELTSSFPTFWSKS